MSTNRTKELKQAPHKRAYDRIRKAKEYARKGIERQKELLLGSFLEDGNFFESQSRLREMEHLAEGVLSGLAGDSLFTTFPASTWSDPTYKPAYEKETQVVGCVPIYLMASLLNDLKPRHRFLSIIPLAQEIGRRADELQSAKQRGVYYMAHWKITLVEPRQWSEQLTVDWKKRNEEHRVFSHPSVLQIETFGKAILKGLGFKSVSTSTHSFAPGVVYTENSFPQAAHIDFNETNLSASKKSWILHMPLQKEGMLLSVWDTPIKDEERDDNSKHHYIFVPFGSYVALRSDVLHSGVYGSSGNCRFHMILKSRNQVQVAGAPDDGGKDRLYYYPHPSDDHRPVWDPVFRAEKKRFRFYTEQYIGQLQKHTGKGVTDDLMKCVPLTNPRKATTTPN
jgi:hypothetical protein